MRAITPRLSAVFAFAAAFVAFIGGAAAQMPIDLTGKSSGWTAHRLSVSSPGGEVELGVLRIAEGDGQLAFEGLTAVPKGALDQPLHVSAAAASAAPSADALVIDPARRHPVGAPAKSARAHLVVGAKGAVRHVIEWQLGECRAGACAVDTVVVYSLVDEAPSDALTGGTLDAAAGFPIEAHDLRVGASRP